MIVKPILSIITLPLNLATLGLFSFVINAVILYLLTILVSSVSISAFTFRGVSFFGFIVPKIELNTFLAFIISSIVFSFSVMFLSWITEK